MTREIAVYGKGGIGKSTISVNLAAALAEHARVLQIGCDPKHDSTRLLTGGRKITPILDYIRDTGPADYRMQDILTEGFRGIGCMEAGGPRPGVGCAGRGIITAFDLLEQFHVKDGYDYVIYDVLGDVVCGGFSMPIRKGYAQKVFMVTSGENMSIYAASNIALAVDNFRGRGYADLGGLILNRRGVEKEREKVEVFAGDFHTDITGDLPRSETVQQAEILQKTVIEAFPGSEMAGAYRELARNLLEVCRKETERGAV